MNLWKPASPSRQRKRVSLSGNGAPGLRSSFSFARWRAGSSGTAGAGVGPIWPVTARALMPKRTGGPGSRGTWLASVSPTQPGGPDWATARGGLAANAAHAATTRTEKTRAIRHAILGRSHRRQRRSNPLQELDHGSVLLGNVELAGAELTGLDLDLAPQRRTRRPEARIAAVAKLVRGLLRRTHEGTVGHCCSAWGKQKP